MFNIYISNFEIFSFSDYSSQSAQRNAINLDLVKQQKRNRNSADKIYISRGRSVEIDKQQKRDECPISTFSKQ